VTDPILNPDLEPGPDPVRELAEDLFHEVLIEGGIDGVEAMLRAFLAEREERQSDAEGWRLLDELWSLCNRHFIDGKDAPIRNWLDKHNAEAETIRGRLLKKVQGGGWSLAEQMARDAAGEIEG
jgi:hypothetical protein